MNRDRIKKILSQGENGQKVSIGAWVRSKRVSKNFAFVVVNDGSTQQVLQLVVDSGTSAFEMMKDIQTGAGIFAQGELVESPAKGQKWEVKITDLKILGNADEIGRAHV